MKHIFSSDPFINLSKCWSNFLVVSMTWLIPGSVYLACIVLLILLFKISFLTELVHIVPSGFVIVFSCNTITYKKSLKDLETRAE